MLDKPDPQFNSDWLRALLNAKGVRKPRATWHLSNAALSILAVNVAVRVYRQRNPEKPIEGMEAFHDETGLSAAETLRESLLQRREAAMLALHFWEGAHHLGRETQIERFTLLDQNIAKALADLERMMPLLRVTRYPIAQTPAKIKWHPHAILLAREFAGRYRECNPGQSCGISNNGPLVAFVTAVIPFITDEAPSLGAVAIFLKENRAEIEG